MLPVAVVDIDLGAHARPGSAAAFLVLVALVVSFLAIRTSARLTRSVSWWPGGVESGGVHLHHLVWGICLMMLSGFLAFAVPLDPPWWHVVAILFGVGAGFTLDEFALWVYLDDVYWSPEGRTSFDAVVVAVVFAALVLLGTTPLGLDDPGSIAAAAVTVTIALGLSIVCFLKGRIMYGLIGLFIPIFSIVGAVRLGMPRSPWAKRFYGVSRLERSRARFSPDRRMARLQRGIGNLIAGAPTPDPELPVASTPEPDGTSDAGARSADSRAGRVPAESGHDLAGSGHRLPAMPSITRIDFVTIPTQDVDRSTAFYRDVLGLEECPVTVDKPFSEFDLGDTTLSIWDPTTVGNEFKPNTNGIALHTDDVAGMRAQLEGKGVAFFADTLDTGVCHMAFFADPDGNPLTLHGRHVPRS